MKVPGKTRWLMLGVFCLAAGALAMAQDVVIIANPEMKVSQISERDLRDIFTGAKSRLHNGSNAVPALLRGGPAHEVFVRKHLGQSPEEFRASWRRLVFAGQGAMPREFGSEPALVEYVARTPGALGYVASISPGGGVKTLTVSDKTQ
jgi:ABC-type phosphate transport system substrate-binding protein